MNDINFTKYKPHTNNYKLKLFSKIIQSSKTYLIFNTLVNS